MPTRPPICKLQLTLKLDNDRWHASILTNQGRRVCVTTNRRSEIVGWCVDRLVLLSQYLDPDDVPLSDPPMAAGQENDDEDYDPEDVVDGLADHE